MPHSNGVVGFVQDKPKVPRRTRKFDEGVLVRFTGDKPYIVIGYLRKYTGDTKAEVVVIYSNVPEPTDEERAGMDINEDITRVGDVYHRCKTAHLELFRGQLVLENSDAVIAAHGGKS